MKLRVVVVAVTAAVAAAWPALQLLRQAYPSDFLKRHALELCASYDIAFNRLDQAARERCYREMPEGPPQEAHARIGVAVSQFDLRQAAGRSGAPGNDIRVIQETQTAHGGISR
jgi:hypothetical protein